MTQIPIFLVAALRKTSVMFAFHFGIFYLKEPLYPQRILGILGVCLSSSGDAY